MTLNEHDRAELWRLAGSRCSICKHPVVATADGPGRPAHEHPIRGAIGSLIVTGGYLDSHHNHILLCAEDARTVRERQAMFPAEVLSRLKREHEQWTDRVFRGGPVAGDDVRVTVLVHTAMFAPTSPPYYFIKITNEHPAVPVRIDRVWFDTEPPAPVDNDARPLPAEIQPGELFETWILKRDVPDTPGAEFLARAQVHDGPVLTSRPNGAVSPAGQVGGGGRPLSALRDAVAEANRVGGRIVEKDWHVFISHATEDKDRVVRPLAEALRRRGLRVWYDEFEMRLGDSLRERIDEGIARSTFGVVVLSPAFIAKHWTKYELNGLVSRFVYGQQTILPVWHDMTVEDVMAFSPSLADRVARSTGTHSVEAIAVEIAGLVTSVVGPLEPHDGP
ncbi:toll/interleukin-1 receptor domain-containing protein [Dactylosporangium sp. NPDC051485]|uniref:toll/interleukin-1 receptor domain-containing protein n=1 Tax=Dactylosporangium sp. NPDC051485 TaxID=3154846 RepID=UPI003429BFCE